MALGAAPAHAQVSAAAPAKGSIEIARKLVAVMGVEKSYDQVFSPLVPLVTGNIIGLFERETNTPPAIRLLLGSTTGRERVNSVLSEEILASFRSRYAKMLEGTAAEYAAKFSDNELKDLLAFYSSGTGAKLVAVTPDLQARLGKIGEGVGEEAGMEAIPKAMKRLAQPTDGTK